MAEFVSGVASGLLNKLATKACQKTALARGLKGDVEKLRNSMRIINAFLMDAENKQASNRGIAEWLKQLGEAFDDAVDIVDEIEYEAKRNEVVKMYGSTSTKVRGFFSYSTNPLTFRVKMAHKIRDVKQRIHEKISEGRNLGIAEQHANASTPKHDLSWRETASFVPPRVTGRIEEKEELISLLVRQQTPSQPQANNVDVIPIVGMGGLGKTTLAQMVYNDDRVKDNFDMRMWVCVADNDDDGFDIKKLIVKIVQAAPTTEKGFDYNSTLDKLLSLLDQNLRRSRFLLVLDDVWNEHPKKWDDLRNYLLWVARDMKSEGSKIIVTTRSKDTALIMTSGPQIHLQPLPEKECWEVFIKCAFQEADKEAEQYPWLKEIGEDIVRKCKGLPLAITTLGCLLRSKSHDENEWKKIRDNAVWETKDDGILPSLRLSYNHLPPEVKRCFSYCSLLGKDYTYHGIELIMFWMAHGLLQPTNEKEEPEQIGELYIEKLVSASLLQIDYDNFNLIPHMNMMELNTFRMHDLVLDLSKSTMKESNKTRTFIRQWPLVSSMEWTSDEFKYLKVLDLQGMQFDLLPDDCFAKMKHLRYLDLFGCDRLGKLPDSLFELQILQGLIIQRCSNLQELPRNMKNLVSLRNLLVTVGASSSFPMDIGCLKELQLLLIANCSNLVSLPSALGRLTVLKKLMIYGCQKLANFEDEEEEGKQHVAVHDLNLQVLVIEGSPKLEALPNWLKRCNKTLRYMAIQDTGLKALPEWLPNLTSLDRLRIKRCRELSCLPKNMDQLRSLQHLNIIDCPKLSLDRTKIGHVPDCELPAASHFHDFCFVTVVPSSPSCNCGSSSFSSQMWFLFLLLANAVPLPSYRKCGSFFTPLICDSPSHDSI